MPPKWLSYGGIMDIGGLGVNMSLTSDGGSSERKIANMPIIKFEVQHSDSVISAKFYQWCAYV